MYLYHRKLVLRAFEPRGARCRYLRMGQSPNMAKEMYYEKGRKVVNEIRQRSVAPADLWGYAAMYHIGIRAMQLDPQLEISPSKADDGEEQMFSIGLDQEKLGVMDTPHFDGEFEIIARRKAEAQEHVTAGIERPVNHG